MISKKCLHCDDEFENKNKKVKYCSFKCSRTHNKNLMNPFIWNNATSEERLDRMNQQFQRFVIKNEVGCWGWRGSLRKGYGNINCGSGKSMTASRASWLFHHGEIPTGKDVLHKCDTPSCNNPNHLFLGTAKDNVKDMIEKGRSRYARGENQGHSKLSEKEILEIKQELLKDNSKKNRIFLSVKYNVQEQQIYKIGTNKQWKHVIVNQ